MAWPSASARTKTWGTEILTAGDLDGQFDLLHTYNNDQLNGTTGHKHSGGTNDGPLIPLTTGVTGILPVANGGTGSSAAINTAGGVVVPTGAVNAASGAVVLNSSGFLPVYYAYVKVSETQTSGTNGGTSTTGSWITRVLNTKDSDTGTIATLAANQVTLPAGTYLFKSVAPFFNSGATQTRLQNITDGATLLTGNSQNNSNASTGTPSFISGVFTLSGAKAVAVQYQCSASQANTGLGYPASFGTEVYTVAEFTKIG